MTEHRQACMPAAEPILAVSWQLERQPDAV
jgi:hypothetical protein